MWASVCGTGHWSDMTPMPHLPSNILHTHTHRIQLFPPRIDVCFVHSFVFISTHNGGRNNGNQQLNNNDARTFAASGMARMNADGSGRRARGARGMRWRYSRCVCARQCVCICLVGAFCFCFCLYACTYAGHARFKACQHADNTNFVSSRVQIHCSPCAIRECGKDYRILFSFWYI